MTKFLLGAIAAGLWANALIPLTKSAPAEAQSVVANELISIAANTRQAADALLILATGQCRNAKLC